jgi:hypothetical protein
VRATSWNKKRSQSFIAQSPVVGGTRVEHGILRAVEIAARIDCNRRVVVYVGPGDPYDRDHTAVLDEITAANAGRSQIHTIGVAPYDLNEVLLRQIAACNRGTYKRVN